MNHLSENQSLKAFNTFGIEANARYFAEFSDEETAIAFLTSLPSGRLPLLIIGQGSNILFTGDFPGTVIRLTIRGLRTVNETTDSVIVNAAAGEAWDDLVQYCVAHGWGGVENLSLIPGTVGAAPIQNIGAYGMELKDSFVELEALELKSGHRRSFSREECRFGYRDSIFKSICPGEFLVLSVMIRLSKQPVLHTDYEGIQKMLSERKITHPNLTDIREIILEIRRKKLPDPAVTGNAGSFFRNPVIETTRWKQLQEKYPEIPGRPDPKGTKIPAAWLIEKCGWKGKRAGDAGVHPNQPLVLVNYGKATGKEILNLANLIRQSVYARFDILLEPEVQII